MRHPIRDLVTDWRPGDAEKLAALEMESDVAWPGGGGWQLTAREAERWIRESDLIGAFVTEDGKRLVSICTLLCKPGQGEHCFIPHLNCHPDYHGKKHGKTVLGAAVERAHEEGFRKVDLYTWPGNMKAVPLYKKMGFMWRPDSSVHMENFTPAARRHPLGAAYFARHDWYETQVRSLALEEDRVMRGRVRVYEYLWRAPDGQFLRMVFDRQSWGLIEIQNNELLVGCDLPDEKLVAGVSHPVHWRVVSARPKSVFLTTSADPGVRVDHRDALTVEGEADMETQFVIDPEIPKKTQEPRAAILRSELVVDGLPLELAAGMEVRQAVAVSVDTASAYITSGSAQEVVLTLRSNLDERLTARLEVSPVSKVRVRRRSYRVALSPRGGAEITVAVTAPDPGAAVLEVAVAAQSGRRRIPAKTQRIDLLAVDRGGVAAAVGEDDVLMSGGGLAVRVPRRHGSVAISHALRARQADRLELHSPQIGPPFSWEDLFQEKAEAEVETEPHAAVLCLRSRSTLRPGVVLERRVRIGAGPLVEVSDTVVNGSAQAFDFSLAQRGYTESEYVADTRPRWSFVVPRDGGIYREAAHGGGRGLGDLRLPKEGTAWPEGWMCAERADGCVAGLLWNGAEEVEPGSWFEIKRKGGLVRPGESQTLGPLYALVGDGSWQTVRGWWQTLFGGGPPRSEAPAGEVLRPLDLAMEPDPVVVGRAGADVRVHLRNAGEYTLDGKITLDLPPGLRGPARPISVRQLSVSRPVERRLPLARQKQVRPGPGRIGLQFETEEAVYRASGQALFLPPDAPPVQVEREPGSGVLAIGNGILQARVAPGFAGALISLQRDGREFLNSPYPEPCPRGWRNPWHGGVSPTCGRLWDRLHREPFRYRTMARRGRQGLGWRGVRVFCTIEQEDARGHGIAFDYLMAPGVAVLALIPSCWDELGVRSRAQVGFEVFPAFADRPGSARFWNPFADGVEVKAPPHSARAGAWDWGGLIGTDGQALFVSVRGEGATAGGGSEGPDGCTMGAGVQREMPAGGRIEGLFFLVPALSPEEAHSQAIWHGFTELP